MATAQMDTVMQHLRRAVLRQDGVGWADGQLLDYFIDQQDEAAFEALVRRHGPMVFGVCRRVVGNHHDAEDAFQATFLVLARKASSIRPRERVANWLHGVALRTAMKVKAMTAKRRGREKQVSEIPEPEMAQKDQWRDLQPLLDQELTGLPENYRLPILLCDLEGKSIKKTAQQLGWPQGTLAGRLARGRKLLAKRLANRGVALSAGSLAVIVSQNVASAGVPTSLISSTVKAVAMIAAGQATLAGAVPAKVAILMEGVLKAMLVTKFKSVVEFMLAVFATVGLGAGLLAYGTAAGDKKDNEKAKAVAPQKDAATSNKEAQPQDVTKDDKERLQGVWQMESMEGDGQKISSDDLKNAPPEQTKVWIVGNKWITKDDQGKDQKQTFRLDPSKSPRAINIGAVDGTIDQLGIYRLEGDQLTICMWGGDQPAKQERPKAFTTGKGSKNMLIVYKRVTEKKSEKPDKSKDDNKMDQPNAKPGLNNADAVAPNKAVAKSDKDQLQGKWLLVSCKCNGEDRKEQPWSKDALLVIEEADGKLVCKFGTVFKDKAKLIEILGGEEMEKRMLWADMAGESPAKVIERFGEEMEKHTQGILKLDVRTKPKTLDVIGVVYETGIYLGIYKLDGNTLTWCMTKALTPDVAKTGNDRPTDFSTTSGDCRTLMVYKRQKETEPKSRDSSPVPAKKADAGKTDLDRLQGVWSAVSMEQGGEPCKLEKAVFMVDGKRACFQSSDREIQGGLYLDATRTPKTYDLAMSTRTIEGIYSLEVTPCACATIREEWRSPRGRAASSPKREVRNFSSC